MVQSGTTKRELIRFCYKLPYIIQCNRLTRFSPMWLIQNIGAHVDGGMGEELIEGCVVCSQSSVLPRHNSQHSEIKIDGQIKRAKTVWLYIVKMRREKKGKLQGRALQLKQRAQLSPLPLHCHCAQPRPPTWGQDGPSCTCWRRLLGDGVRSKRQKQQEKEQGIFLLPASLAGRRGCTEEPLPLSLSVQGAALTPSPWLCRALTFPQAGTTQKLLSWQRTMKGIGIVWTTAEFV